MNFSIIIFTVLWILFKPFYGGRWYYTFCCITRIWTTSRAFYQDIPFGNCVLRECLFPKVFNRSEDKRAHAVTIFGPTQWNSRQRVHMYVHLHPYVYILYLSPLFFFLSLSLLHVFNPLFLFPVAFRRYAKTLWIFQDDGIGTRCFHCVL